MKKSEEAKQNKTRKKTKETQEIIITRKKK